MSAAQAEAAGIRRGKLAGLVKAGLVERVMRGYIAGTMRTCPSIIVWRYCRTEHAGRSSIFSAVCAPVPQSDYATAARGMAGDKPQSQGRAFASPGGADEAVPVLGRVFLVGHRASHRIEGVTVRVYSVAKTVADCFKFRNKVGLDVAMEAVCAKVGANGGSRWTSCGTRQRCAGSRG